MTMDDQMTDNQSPCNSQPEHGRGLPIIACLTLIVDAYLVLAAQASVMLQNDLGAKLLPFGDAATAEETRFWVLIVTTWTAVLAVGCLTSRRRSAGWTPWSGVMFFALVLAVPWLFLLFDLVMKLWTWGKGLFLYGL